MTESRNGLILLAAASAMAGSTGADAQNRNVVRPGTTYWISAETSTGLGTGMSTLSRGVSPSELAARAAGSSARSARGEPTSSERGGLGGLRGKAIGRIGSMFGGSLGGRRKKAAAAPQAEEEVKAESVSFNRGLILQLGTSRPSPAAPTAEHLPPAGLKTGPSLPLLTPHHGSSAGSSFDAKPGNTERPQGKMMIFWGCGDKAAAAPIAIDFAKLGTRGAGNLPSLSVKRDDPPAEGSSTTFGHWPNERSSRPVPSDGSLVGTHQIRGNYTPNIDFALSSSQDFLAPLLLNAETKTTAGGRKLTWNAVPHALGYFAQVLGSTSDDTIVIWSSSAKALSQSELMDYVAEAEVRRLVAHGHVLSPATTSCTVPAEVVKAAPDSMVQMIAYGSEANITGPAQVAGARAGAGQSWSVKMRRKSTATALLD